MLFTQNTDVASVLEHRDNTMLRKTFVSAVLTLLSGGIFAQILPYIATIFLAHLFVPTEFGIFALFSSISAAMALGATGRYELAVLLPRKARDADALVLASILIGGSVSIIIAIGFLFIGQPFVLKAAPEGIWGALPFSIFAIVIYQTLMNWCLRHGLYGHITVARFAQAGGGALISIALGWYGCHTGLVVGYIISWVLAAVLYSAFIMHSGQFKITPAIGRIKVNIVHYSSHAVYGAIPALLDSVSVFCVMFIIAHHYGSEYVGQYSLSKQFFYGPISLIVGAVGQVVLRESSQLRLNDKSDFRLFKHVFRYGTYAAALYGLFLLFIAPQVIKLFFGPTWQPAGLLTVILGLGYAMRLVITPLSVFLVSHGAMSRNGAWQVLYFVSINLFFFFKPREPLLFFAVLTVVDVVLYAIYFFLIWSVIHKKGIKMESKCVV